MSLWLFTELWFCKTERETIQDDLYLILTGSSWRAGWHFLPISTIKCKALSYVTLADFLIGHNPGWSSAWDLFSMTGQTLSAHLNVCSPFFACGDLRGYTGLARSLGWLMQPLQPRPEPAQAFLHLHHRDSFQTAPLHDAESLPVQQKEQWFCTPGPASCSTWVVLGDLFTHRASLASWG